MDQTVMVNFFALGLFVFCFAWGLDKAWGIMRAILNA